MILSPIGEWAYLTGFVSHLQWDDQNHGEAESNREHVNKPLKALPL